MTYKSETMYLDVRKRQLFKLLQLFYRKWNKYTIYYLNFNIKS